MQSAGSCADTAGLAAADTAGGGLARAAAHWNERQRRQDPALFSGRGALLLRLRQTSELRSPGPVLPGQCGQRSCCPWADPARATLCTRALPLAPLHAPFASLPFCLSVPAPLPTLSSPHKSWGGGTCPMDTLLQRQTEARREWGAPNVEGAAVHTARSFQESSLLSPRKVPCPCLSIAEGKF